MRLFPRSQDYLVLLFVAFSVLSPSYCTDADANVRDVGNRRPAFVKVGALFAFNSTIGRVAKTAIELAVNDVNSNENLLNGTKLVLTTVDSSCNAFVGTVEALELMEKDVVAIVGPQFSVLGHAVSHIANELQIPLLSFAATDPTLTSYEYPYFIRMTHSDVSQMAAIADFVSAYGWKEVVAVYIDDDYGRNGISALGDALASVGAKISNKAAMTTGVGRSEMDNVLASLTSMDTRIFVVHMYSDAGLKLISEAKNIGMLSTGYVWIATDWLSSVLDSGLLEVDNMESLQGLISLRPHTPNSGQQHVLRQRWKNLQTANMVNVSLNAFGLYAYDSILMIAHSLNAYLNQGGKISFAEQYTLSSASGSKLELAKLKVFKGGAQLRKIILRSSFNGITGRVQLDKNRDLTGSTFDIISVAGTRVRSIGYWSNRTGLSVTPPENTAAIRDGRYLTKPKLSDIIWPGESKTIPRGWVHEKPLVIGVPRKTGYKEFVTVNSSKPVKGFCIDVFDAAVKLLPYTVRYTFKPYGTGNSTPNYDDLVEQVALQNFDAVVGDVAILTNRWKIVDFTQPYVESGLVVVVPVRERGSNAWAFLRPFTLEMWCTTAAFFLVIGAVVWILEHRSNQEFRGHPKQQVWNGLWFAFSTMFSKQGQTVSMLGRAVLIIWLFVILIIKASYTANLSAILTAQQLSPTIQGIHTLVRSDLPIGYQTGSFVRNYLSNQYNIAKSRLVPLDSPERYAQALTLGPKKGGVAAVVDELPYIHLFLSMHCGFRIVGGEFTKREWGFVSSLSLDFVLPSYSSLWKYENCDKYSLQSWHQQAFPKNSPFTADMSEAILSLSERGELQRIHDKWLNIDSCETQSSKVDSNKFGLKIFWGLFLVTGVVCFIALFIYFCRMICLFRRYAHRGIEDSKQRFHALSSSARFVKSFARFIDERENDERKERLKRKRAEKKRNLEVEMCQPEPFTSLSQTFSVDHSISPL